MKANTVDKPLVSVVIATYDMSEYLPQAIQSVLKQTYTHWELHIVDDGSTDPTVQAIEPFLNDPRVQYHYQNNQGQTKAKNRGILESRGDYVGFLDADDLWLRDKLEKQLALFRDNPNIGVVYGRARCINEAGAVLEVPQQPLHRGQITGALLINNFIPFGTALIHRHCIDCLGPFDDSLCMGIDYDLWLRYSVHFAFDFIDSPLMLYRIWPGQMSRNTRGRYINGIRIMKRFLSDNPGAVGVATIREAWAHTYVGYGRSIVEDEGTKLEALQHYITALRYHPFYIPAWKSLARLALGI